MASEDSAKIGRRTGLLVTGLVGLLLLGALAGVLLAQSDGESGTTVEVTPLSTIQATETLQASTTLKTPVTTTLPPPTTLVPVATEFTFIAVEDTFVDSTAPNEAFGAEEEIEIENDGSETRMALVRFDLGLLPPQIPVTQAKLRLTVVDEATVFGSVSTVGGTWNETATTWIDAPPIGEEISLVPAGSQGPIEVDVTPAVTGPGVLDLYLTTASVEGIDFVSSESPGGGPELVVVLGGTEGPPQTGDTVLVGAGDIAVCSSDGDELTASLLDTLVASASEAVVYTAGDNAYENGSGQNFADCYEPSWGRHKAITRPSPGSREYRTPGASGYFDYFGDAAGDPALGYYSYGLGSWHIVVLNSNCDEIGGCDEGSSQEVWLQADLQAADSECTIAYWQEPLFSSGVAGGNDEVRPLVEALYDAEAEAVIHGNDHFYERFSPQTPDGIFDEDEGLRQFIVGTGGRSLDPFGAVATNSEVRINNTFGVLSLRLLPDGYIWDFLSVMTGESLDRGGAACF
jgi:hypothetical protein